MAINDDCELSGSSSTTGTAMIKFSSVGKDLVVDHLNDENHHNDDEDDDDDRTDDGTGTFQEMLLLAEQSSSMPTTTTSTTTVTKKAKVATSTCHKPLESIKETRDDDDVETDNEKTRQEPQEEGARSFEDLAELPSGSFDSHLQHSTGTSSTTLAPDGDAVMALRTIESHLSAERKKSARLEEELKEERSRTEYLRKRIGMLVKLMLKREDELKKLRLEQQRQKEREHERAAAKLAGICTSPSSASMLLSLASPSSKSAASSNKSKSKTPSKNGTPPRSPSNNKGSTPVQKNTSNNKEQDESTPHSHGSNSQHKSSPSRPTTTLRLTMSGDEQSSKGGSPTKKKPNNLPPRPPTTTTTTGTNLLPQCPSRSLCNTDSQSTASKKSDDGSCSMDSEQMKIRIEAAKMLFRASKSIEESSPDHSGARAARRESIGSKTSNDPTGKKKHRSSSSSGKSSSSKRKSKSSSSKSDRKEASSPTFGDAIEAKESKMTTLVPSTGSRQTGPPRIAPSRSFSSRKIGDECSCSMTVLTQNHDPSHVEFFLPKLDFSCQCDDCQRGLKGENGCDPKLLKNILRPWQVEFLNALGIQTIDDLLKAKDTNSKGLVKAMMKWREVRRMTKVKKKSCFVALHIWTRTASVIKKSIKSGETIRFLSEISLSAKDDDDDETVSTLGCPEELVDELEV